MDILLLSEYKTIFNVMFISHLTDTIIESQVIIRKTSKCFIIILSITTL